MISEGAKLAYKRNGGQQITRYFRCTTGVKAGKLAADPASCGTRPNPKRIRHGRIVAKQKGAVRVRKTQVAKKQQVSKTVTQLNKMLTARQSSNSNNTSHQFKEYSFLTFLEHQPLFEHVSNIDLDIVTEQLLNVIDYIDQLPITEHDIHVDINNDHILLTVESIDNILEVEFELCE